MPQYEYKCQICDKISVLLIGVNQDGHKLQCLYCGSKKIIKQLSSFGVKALSSCEKNCIQKIYSKGKCQKQCCKIKKQC